MLMFNGTLNYSLIVRFQYEIYLKKVVILPVPSSFLLKSILNQVVHNVKIIWHFLLLLPIFYFDISIDLV